MNRQHLEHRYSARWRVCSGLLTAAIWLLATAAAAQQTSYSFTMLVKTTNNTQYLYALNDPSHVASAPEDCTCIVTGFTPRLPLAKPGGPDPNQSATPVTIGACSVFDGVNWKLPLTFSFPSLKDLGTWTIVCDGTHFDVNNCWADANQACKLYCNPYIKTKWLNTFTWFVTVQNNPPHVTLAPTTFHASKSPVTLAVTVTDPDGGPPPTVPNPWRFLGPGGRTVTPQMLSENHKAQATFSDALDIGSWTSQIDVIDSQGEQTTQSVSFSVTDTKPVISVTANGPPGNAFSVIAGDQLPFTITVTDADGDETSLECTVKGPKGQVALPKAAVLPQLGEQKPPLTPMFNFAPWKPDLGTWTFSCTAANAFASVTSTFTVNVQPKKPKATVLSGTFPPAIPEGAAIVVVADNHDAYGDPLKSFQWDLLQGPGKSPPGQTDAVGGAATFTMTKPAPGTWRLRLTVEDDVAQSDTKNDIFVLVDSLPFININDPGIIAVNQGFTIDGSQSQDPDFDSPHWVMPPFTETKMSKAPAYQWRLVSWPQDADPNLYYQGTVDEVLSIDGTSKNLMFSAARLFPVEWLFELDVTDSQGNQASGVQPVTVAGLNLEPVAIIQPPARIYSATGPQDPLKLQDGFTEVAFDASKSFDLDALFKNLGNGIQSYAWLLLSQPNGCNLHPFWDKGAVNVPSVALGFQQLSGVPSACLGSFFVNAVVTDLDMPTPHSKGTSALAVIVNCKSVLCIDHPTEQDPQYVPLAVNTDVLIYYHLSSLINNQAIYDPNSPFGQNGSRVRLFISKDQNNATIPVFSNTYEVDPAPNAGVGGERVLHWSGYDSQNQRPASGKYNVALQLIDGAGNNSNAVSETHAILIQTLDVTLSSVDRYVDGTQLPKSPIQVTWSVSGAQYVTPGFDQLRLLVLDANGFEVGYKDVPSNSPNPLAWDGTTDKGALRPNDYFLQLKAIQTDGSTLGVSAEMPFTVYQLGFHLTGGNGPPGMVPLFVNNDDDDFNGVADLDEATHADEHDLLEVFIDFQPSGLSGTLTLTSGGHSFKVWPAADKLGPELTLPANFANMPIPKSVFLEGTRPALADLKADFVTTQGNAKLNQAVMSIDVVDFSVSYDTNGNFLPDPGDITTLSLSAGLWDFAFRRTDDSSGLAGTLYNEQDDQHNFVGRDTKRFFVKVTDPAAAGSAEINAANFTWYTVAADKMTDVDHPPDSSLALTETQTNSGVFASASLMLVTDEEDAKQETNTGLAAHPGLASYGAPNHRTRRIDYIDGAVVFRYQSSLPSAPPHLLRIPLYPRRPVYQRTVFLRILNFEDPAHSVGPTSPQRVAALMQSMRNRYAVMGIHPQFTYDATKDVIDVAKVNIQNIDLMNVGPSMGGVGTTVLSSEESKLAFAVRQMEPYANNPDTIYVILVRKFSGGKTVADGIGDSTGNTQGKSCVFVGDEGSSKALAHEVGHMLMDSSNILGGLDAAGHYIGPQKELNLMYDTDISDKGIANPKRIWNDDSHVVHQIDIARASRFVK